jgi:hypothetical protein
MNESIEHMMKSIYPTIKIETTWNVLFDALPGGVGGTIKICSSE